MKPKKRFIEFLKENGCFKDYMKELKKDKRTMKDPLLDVPREYIMAAFYWETSEKGFDFWDDLDDKWKDLLESESNNKGE